MDNDSLFDGKVILLGGDFRLCLPVHKQCSNRVIIILKAIELEAIETSPNG